MVPLCICILLQYLNTVKWKRLLSIPFLNLFVFLDFPSQRMVSHLPSCQGRNVGSAFDSSFLLPLMSFWQVCFVNNSPVLLLLSRSTAVVCVYTQGLTTNFPTFLLLYSQVIFQNCQKQFQKCKSDQIHIQLKIFQNDSTLRLALSFYVSPFLLCTHGTELPFVSRTLSPFSQFLASVLVQLPLSWSLP